MDSLLNCQDLACSADDDDQAAEGLTDNVFHYQGGRHSWEHVSR